MEEKDNFKSNEENNNEVEEKAAKFLEVGNTVFLEPETSNDDEASQEKEISAFPDTEVSPEVKKALIAATKRADAIVKPTDGGHSFNKKGKEKEMKEELQRNVTTKDRGIKKQPAQDSKENEQIR